MKKRFNKILFVKWEIKKKVWIKLTLSQIEKNVIYNCINWK